MLWCQECQGNRFLSQVVFLPFHRLTRNHPRPRCCTDTLWWQGFVSTSHPRLALNGAPLCFPAQPHTLLPCLTDIFLATSALPSLSITTGHQDWVSVRRFILLLASGDSGCGTRNGVSWQQQVYRHTPLFQTQQLPITLEEIFLAGSFHTSPLGGGQGKETERKQKLIPAWLC